MARVRQVCGECGADVGRGDVRCRGCGSSLEWEEARSSKAGQKKRAPQVAVRPRGLEPWQIISFVAIGVLLAFIGWMEFGRDRTPAASGAAMPSGQMPMPAMAPKVELGPLEAAVAANPQDGEARLRLANGLHDAGQLPRAIEEYKAYLKMHPGNPDARVDLGICYDQLGLADSVQAEKYFALAVAEMEAVVKADPTHQAAAFNLGVVSLHRGDLEGSNRWMMKTIGIDRNSELGMRAQRMLQQHLVTP